MPAHRYLAAIAAALSIHASVARAETPIYVSPGYPFAQHPDINGFCSDCGVGQHVTDQFVLGATKTLGSTDFAVATAAFAPWNIEITIYDSHYKPLYAQINPAGSYTVTDLGNNVSIVHATFHGLTLAAGTYYIGWYDPEGLSIPAYVAGNTLELNGRPLHFAGAAFQINAVPEPASYAMLLAGLVMAGAIRRRQG